MHLKKLFAALVLCSLSACGSAPHYYLCAVVKNNKTFYCESTDPKEKPYEVPVNPDFYAMPIDDYGKIIKYVKQVQKDLERCKK